MMMNPSSEENLIFNEKEAGLVLPSSAKIINEEEDDNLREAGGKEKSPANSERNAKKCSQNVSKAK